MISNHSLQGKRILLGITGGIAAYKTPELVRILKKSGAEVQIILTQSATEFVSSLTLETLSQRSIALNSFVQGAPLIHIDLARWADIFLIAPLSANKLSALAHGLADDLLTTTYLATKAPLWVAPAMNKEMWEHPSTQSNLQKLIGLGATIIGPEFGDQACQEIGFGRMSEPETIVSQLSKLASSSSKLLGKKVLITAGPTREAVDPVRFISNRSSGKMGYALALEAKAQGAQVTLITGPSALPVPTGVKTIPVVTGQEMYANVFENITGIDIFIGAAAVSDYKVKTVSKHKLKKNLHNSLYLELVPNIDILASVAAQPIRPFCVGFAAETDNLEYNAKVKLKEKNIDLIALNAIGEPGVGFEVDTNALTVFWNEGSQKLALASKTLIARALLELIGERYDEQKN